MNSVADMNINGAMLDTMAVTSFLFPLAYESITCLAIPPVKREKNSGANTIIALTTG